MAVTSVAVGNAQNPHAVKSAPWVSSRTAVAVLSASAEVSAMHAPSLPPNRPSHRSRAEGHHVNETFSVTAVYSDTDVTLWDHLFSSHLSGIISQNLNIEWQAHYPDSHFLGPVLLVSGSLCSALK